MRKIDDDDGSERDLGGTRRFTWIAVTYVRFHHDWKQAAPFLCGNDRATRGKNSMREGRKLALFQIRSNESGNVGASPVDTGHGMGLERGERQRDQEIKRRSDRNR